MIIWLLVCVSILSGVSIVVGGATAIVGMAEGFLTREEKKAVNFMLGGGTILFTACSPIMFGYNPAWFVCLVTIITVSYLMFTFYGTYIRLFTKNLKKA